MRHRHGLRKLNVTSSHRKAMLQALCNALIEHEAINTTLPKAKELRKTIEPLVTLARRGGSVADKRLAYSRLRNRDSVVKLFEDIAPRFADRPGGYVRVLKNGFRPGDAAPMAFVEFVVRDRGDGMEQPDEAPAEEAEAAAAPAVEEQAPEQEAEVEEGAPAEEAEAPEEAETKDEDAADEQPADEAGPQPEEEQAKKEDK